ncbi:hypothetical protein DSOL_3994 [Desulfosporosinus metallidurans]|uniref:Uncharacterized protein n=1 Tax=Desulfosporosinus metallidurans TaxID=1888891 RepID=A0A1Q8QMB2_9FIRM|nr:hypothetical protein DSOL_3994 [Desulfosporosinus metallidurans]
MNIYRKGAPSGENGSGRRLGGNQQEFNTAELQGLWLKRSRV